MPSLLLTTHYPLFTTGYSLHTTDCSLLTTYHFLPISLAIRNVPLPSYLLLILTTSHMLLTAYYSLLTTHCVLRTPYCYKLLTTSHSRRVYCLALTQGVLLSYYSRRVPVDALGVNRVIGVAGGRCSSYALDSKGAVYSWGRRPTY